MIGKLAQLFLDRSLANAVEQNSLYRTRILLRCGADVHVDDDYSICLAAQRGKLEIARLLLQHGADIHTGLEYPLAHAASQNNLEMLRLLLEHGANPSANSYTILTRAAGDGHIEVVRELIKHGADVHAGNEQALGQAVFHRKPDMVKMLLEEYGADPTVNDHLLVCHAAYYGDPATIDALLEHIFRPAFWQDKAKPEAAIDCISRLEMRLKDYKHHGRDPIAPYRLRGALDRLHHFGLPAIQVARNAAARANPIRPKAARPPRPL